MIEQMMFSNRSEFREWLVRNHDLSQGFWMVYGKAGKLKTIRQSEGLAEALCFGWIDGQIKSIDESKYMMRLTPRRKGSPWSERNRKIAAKLIKKGLMSEAGLAAIERAKKEGTWDIPKAAPASEEQLAGFVRLLSCVEPAYSNFQNMSPSVQKNYVMHYLSAKTEATRQKRLAQIIARLNENKKPM